jgi:hypothetical protein
MGIIPIIIYRDRKSGKELQEGMEREAKWRKIIEEDDAKKRAREERARQEKIEAKRKTEEAIRKKVFMEEQNNPWEFRVLPGGWNIFGLYVTGTISWDGPEEDFKKSV